MSKVEKGTYTDTNKENKKKAARYSQFDVVVADLGNQPRGVQGGIRSVVIISNNQSNHKSSPQITVVPLTTKLKENPVHVLINPEDVKGYQLKAASHFIPEDIMTISKSRVMGKCGYIPEGSAVREQIVNAMIRQLGLVTTSKE